MIKFYYHLKGFRLQKPDTYRKWIQTLTQSHQKRLGSLHYIFVDDAEITEINIQHLQHDYATDIITFDYTEGNKISGEIFISIDTVRNNSKDLNIDFHQELLRVMAHGVLHLCGYNDKTKEEQSKMREEEEKGMEVFRLS